MCLDRKLSIKEELNSGVHLGWKFFEPSGACSGLKFSIMSSVEVKLGTWMSAHNLLDRIEYYEHAGFYPAGFHIFMYRASAALTATCYDGIAVPVYFKFPVAYGTEVYAHSMCRVVVARQMLIPLDWEQLREDLS